MSEVVQRDILCCTLCGAIRLEFREEDNGKKCPECEGTLRITWMRYFREDFSLDNPFLRPPLKEKA